MILRGLLVNELERCLKECQDTYENNLQFNRFSTSYKQSLKGIRAVDMSGEVIIAKDGEKTILVNVDHNQHINPFFKEQKYCCVKRGDDYNIDAYNVSVYENGLWFATRTVLKSPIHVVDFLKHNQEIRAIAFTLRVADSKKAGARRSGRGRRTVSACWHVHRDIMMKIFGLNPNANLKTVMAHYKDKVSFYDLYPETANTNVGSQMQPAYPEELCECESRGCA